MIRYRKAVLIIHGFAGGTYDQEPLLFNLQSKFEFDVYNFTLPGHRTNLSSNVKYEDWINSVNDKIEILKNKGYKKIYLIGHSMGGILACIAAVNNPIVKKVVLVAPAFQFLSLKDENTFMKAIKNGPDILKTYKGKEVFSRFLKVSFSQLREFEKLVSLSLSFPARMNVPTLIVQGTSDNLVPYESSENIYEQLKCPKWLLEVSNVTHDVFDGEKVDEICNEIMLFLKKKKYNAETIRKW